MRSKHGNPTACAPKLGMFQFTTVVKHFCQIACLFYRHMLDFLKDLQRLAIRSITNVCMISEKA